MTGDDTAQVTPRSTDRGRADTETEESRPQTGGVYPPVRRAAVLDGVVSEVTADGS